MKKVLEFDTATAAYRIKLVMEVIDSGKLINTDRTGLNTWLNDIWSRARGYNRNNDSTKRRRFSVADDRFYGSASTGDTGRYSGRAGEDYQKSIIKYSLSPLDTDIEELTPERKREILKQFEKDRVGLDKVSAKQAWGERAVR
ncbi:MAG: hypothetical protein Q4G23_01310 [Clostridia bacterium]|nr:hypothetical protein [Clostridia bacterium]